MEEEYKTSPNFHRYINIAERRVTSTPPAIQCKYNLGIYEFDRVMEYLSIGLYQYFMADILIINVRVGSGYFTYTDKHHHGINADLLAWK